MANGEKSYYFGSNQEEEVDDLIQQIQNAVSKHRKASTSAMKLRQDWAHKMYVSDGLQKGMAVVIVTSFMLRSDPRLAAICQP